MDEFFIDDIGPWSEVKLDIIREYAAAYSRILTARSRPRLTHVYIDAFAGAGVHSSRKTGNIVDGSPAVALQTTPPFREYHFVDLSGRSLDTLEGFVIPKFIDRVDRETIFIYNEDCNKVLVESVFPRVRYADYRRALCLLDPYGLHLDWSVVQTAGRMKSVDIFLNFPIADMNRNVLHRDSGSADAAQIERMTRFWGDESWHNAAYSRSGNLFGWEEKTSNEHMAEAYRKRLKDVAGFQYVPEPVPMRNSRNATVYYLFFASHKPAASDIVIDIFSKYRNK